MIPILYQENETNFNHNGIGILFDTKDYTVTEERNGPYELELVYPAGGRWAKELKDFRFISAKPNDEEDSHIFRIYETVKNLEEDTITVYAATKSNELGGNLVQDVSVTDVNAQQALNAIKAGLTHATSYNFISDIQTTSSGKWDKQSPLSAIVGSDGSVVSKWGGELKRTNDTIYLYGRRGTNKVTTIRQGKGLVGFKMTTSIKGLVTTILPYFTYTPSNSDVPVTIKGSLVNSSLMSNYPVRYISAVDFSQHNEILPTTEGLTPEQYSTQVLNNLNTVASAYFVYMNPGCDKPKVTIEVDLAQLSDSSEYEQFRKLEHIALTDTVVVWVEKFNVDVEVTINEVTYNGMSERVTKFVAGSAKSGIIQDSEKRYTEQIDKIVEYVNTVENGIYNSIRISADSKNNIFSGYTTPDESLVKFDDIWYKPVADGDIEMYRWDGDSWVLAVVNADRIAIGTLDANRINVINLNASNLSTGTVTGASGGWNLVTGEFWLGSSKANSKFLWDGDGLTIKVGSGQTVEEYVSNEVNELESIVVDRFEAAEADIEAANGAIALRALKTEVEAPILKQNTAPAHINGRLWLDTSVTPNVLKRSTGSAWVKVTPTTGAEIGLTDESIVEKVESMSEILAKKAEVKLVDDAWKAMFSKSASGKNLAINSYYGKDGVKTYLVALGYLSENWVVGETYTVTISGNPSQRFGLWRDYGGTLAGYIDYDPASGLYKGTFVCPAKTVASSPENEFTIYNYPDSGSSNLSNIWWLTIEKGPASISSNSWTPSSEDSSNGVNLISRSTTFYPGNVQSGITPSIQPDGSLKVEVSASNTNWHSGWYDPKSLYGLEDSFGEGETYTITFWINRGPNTSGIPDIYLKDGMGYYQLVQSGPPDQGWYPMSYTGSWKKANPVSLHFGWMDCLGTFYIKKWKLEKGAVATPWTPSPYELYAGITKIDQDGVNVSVSNSDVNTQIAYNGLDIRDGGTSLASFGDIGAVIPRAVIGELVNSKVVQLVSGGTYYVGAGQTYTDLNSLLNSVFKDGSRYLQNTVHIYVTSNLSGSVTISGLSGAPFVIHLSAGIHIYGSFNLINCSNIIIISGEGYNTSWPTIHGGPGIWVSNAKLYAYYLNLDGEGASSAVGVGDFGMIHLAACDFARCSDGLTIGLSAVVVLREIRGNTASVVANVSLGAMVIAIGSCLKPGAGNRWYTMNQGVVHDYVNVELNSVYLPPATPPPSKVPQTFTQVFTSATIDTLVHGKTDVNPYYGASAAQNRWDSSKGWNDGRIRFGAEVSNFIASGYGANVQIRLRRKNSSHGNSGAVMPAPYNHSASFPSGATRGGWTGWASLSPSLFTSGGATLTYYNGVQGVSGYAIWDAVEVWVQIVREV